MNLSLPLSLATRLALILDGLARAVAARSARGPSWLGGQAPLAGVMITLIWERVKRAEGRVLGLLARFQAGRLRVATGVARVAGSGGRGESTGRRATVSVPRRFGWVLPLVPCQAAGFAAQLRLVLAEPEMMALLAASAQARRILQPVCRMLGIEAALLTPQPGAPVPVPVVDPPEVAVAWNLGVVMRPVAGQVPPGDSGWRLAQGP